MTLSRGLVVTLLFAVGVGTAVLFAQNRDEPAAPAGSLAALTAEIHQLRLSVEEATRSQVQTQALGVSLSVQQGRILQVANRLEAARNELDTATRESQRLAATIAEMEALVQQTNDPQRQTALAAQSR